MIVQEFRDALRLGKTVYGTLITSTSPGMFAHELMHTNELHFRP